LLSDAGEKHSVAGEDRRLRECQTATGGRGFSDQRDPVVHPPVVMPPHGVVEACRHHTVIGPRRAVIPQHRLEQGVVAHVRQSRAMHVEIIGQAFVGLEPHGLTPDAFTGGVDVHRGFDVAQVEVAFMGPVVSIADRRVAEHSAGSRQSLRIGQVWKDVLSAFEVVPRDGAQAIAGTHLLIAVGRRPNTDDLDLDKAGVQTDDRGYIVVDDELRTNVEHIWAMGDCNGRGAFTHTSYNDFEIVAANVGVLDGVHRRVSDRVPTYALYIDPPLGRAGMTVDQVRASGRKALVGKRPMTRVGRAIEKGETEGFMKVVVDAETDDIHPTVSELVPTMLQGLRPLE
jgi:pyridine nucleotide-disulfide oxidoreductase